MIDLPSRRAVLASPALFALSACATATKGVGSLSQTRQTATTRSEDLRHRLRELAAFCFESIPGFQVACIVDGAVAWSEGYGVRASNGARTDAETIFDFGSLTKPVFATAVMRLIEQGVLDLDTPLSSYAPYDDLRDAPQARRVTVRHVLTHQTGLPNWRPFPPGSPLVFARDPGSAFSYSGEGIFWLQIVVEAVTGRPVAEVIQRNVFDPIGMRRSSVVFEPSFRANYAQGFRNDATTSTDSYNKQNADRVAATLGVDAAALKGISTLALRRAAATAASAGERLPSPVLTPVLAAGSLQTTAADYALFATCFMRGSATAGLLAPQTLANMFTPQTRISAHTSYGLGWRLEHTDLERAFWHSGYNNGFHSFALGDPNGQFGIVLTTNSDHGDWLRWPVVFGATGRGGAAILS